MRRNSRSNLAIVVGVLALALMGVDDGCDPKGDPPATDCINGLAPSDPDCRLECRRNGDCSAGEFCDYEVCVNTCLDDDPNCVNTCIGVCVPRECVCPDVWAPVCGVDGQTYGNACEARCAGIEIAHEGECEACLCPAIYDPVCGVDGMTYGNTCEARCAGVEVAHEGECRCVCPAIYDPVCGVDGQTYGNACEARCAGVEIAHEGQCEGPPVCRDDEDCTEAQVCEPGGPGCDTPVCVTGCHEDAQCGPDQICQEVQCVTCPCPGQCADDDSVQPECRADSDCPAGEVCEPGGPGCDTPVCVTGCHEDAQCGPDQICQEVQCVTCPCPGQCADDDSMQPECRADSDCPAGEVCEPGGPGCDTPVCVTGCHEDAQCGPHEICQEVQCVTCPCPGLCAS